MKSTSESDLGVFPVSSSLPYFVALERGFFKEQNIVPEMTRLIGGPPNVAALITNQIDVAERLDHAQARRRHHHRGGGDRPLRAR
jgi:ABC-type nitrate/sulfonate/bicarbonate transport system substrate-binding protein